MNSVTTFYHLIKLNSYTEQFIVFKGTNFLVQMINLLISLVLVLVDGV